jgi:hypothetical protein
MVGKNTSSLVISDSFPIKELSVQFSDLPSWWAPSLHSYLIAREG